MSEAMTDEGDEEQGTAAERVAEFLDAWEADRGVGNSIRGGNADIPYLFASDLRELLADNEKLRAELTTFHEALPSLQTSSFELGWWKGHEPVPAVGRYTKALLDTTEYGEQLREHYAEPTAAAQHPADGAESDAAVRCDLPCDDDCDAVCHDEHEARGDRIPHSHSRAATQETAEKAPESDAAGLALQFDVAGRDEPTEALSGPVSAPTVAPEIYRAFIVATNRCPRISGHDGWMRKCCFEAGIAAAETLHEQQVRERIAVQLERVGESIARALKERPLTSNSDVVARTQAATYATAAWLIRNPDQHERRVVEGGSEEAGERG